MKKLTALCMAWFVGMTGLAHANQPLDTLKVPIEQILTVLKDPQYQEIEKIHLQQDKIWESIRDIFNFKAIAMKAVGPYWKKFNSEEKSAFTDIFTELLGNSYIKRMQGEFQNETVAYLSEEKISATKALVKTKIIRDNIDIPVNYRMHLVSNEWKIYDVNIEGVSLVKNYRTQFSKILLKDSPVQLIERLKKKVDQQEKEK